MHKDRPFVCHRHFKPNLPNQTGCLDNIQKGYDLLLAGKGEMGLLSPHKAIMSVLDTGNF
jgi:hypothetical protein